MSGEKPRPAPLFIPPLKICLSGGGIKCIAHIGALEVLQEHALLGSVTEYIGISAGALCAFALAIGCSLGELRTMIEQLDFGQIRHLEPETLLQFPDSYGLDTGENVRRLVAAMLRAKGLSPTLTFSELAAASRGPALRVFATDLHTCGAREFSVAVTPDAEIREALMASMCIPLYFQPVRDTETGHLLVDGGVICHSPLKFLTPAECVVALSITFSDDHKPVEEIDGFMPYLRQLYYALDYHYNQELVGAWEDRTMRLDCGGFSTLDFEMPVEQKVALIQKGREGAEAFLWRGRKCPSRRRFSWG